MVVGEAGIQRRFGLVERHLDERQRRLIAAAEAEALGARSISLVSRSTGVSRQAIRRGMRELREPTQRGSDGKRIRAPGGGRKRTSEKDVSLVADLERLAWISTDESFPNIAAASGAQVVKRSARPFHHGTLTG